jgi:isopenicillin N synthase-like dioxygenase
VSIRTRKASERLQSLVAKTLYYRMLAVIEILEPIAVNLTMGLAEFLGGGDSLVHHRPRAFRYWSRLQMNYSQPSQISAPLINDLHEDRDLITITCATGPGLQVQVGSGEFKSVTTEQGELLILPGEIAWLLSGGYVQPLWHRVITCPEQPVRKSLLFFGDIDPSLCEPWVRNEINSGVDIPGRVKAGVTHFGLEGFDLSEGGVE